MFLNNKYGYPVFELTVTAKYDSAIDFQVEEITSWNDSERKEPCDKRLYLKGCIKWDGCSHIHFGDGDGYIHLCGVDAWKEHVAAMQWIYESVSAIIGKDFDQTRKWS